MLESNFSSAERHFSRSSQFPSGNITLYLLDTYFGWPLVDTVKNLFLTPHFTHIADSSSKWKSSGKKKNDQKRDGYGLKKKMVEKAKRNLQFFHIGTFFCATCTKNGLRIPVFILDLRD